MNYPVRNLEEQLASDTDQEKFLRLKVLNFNSPDILGDSPPPTSYDLKSEFVTSPSSKAFSFGIAREAYSKVYIKENPSTDPSVPGPGQYKIPPLVGSEAAKYSLRPKTVTEGINQQHFLIK